MPHSSTTTGSGSTRFRGSRELVHPTSEFADPSKPGVFVLNNAHEAALARCARVVESYDSAPDDVSFREWAGEAFAGAASLGLSTEEIGAATGLTRERIRQVVVWYGRQLHS